MMDLWAKACVMARRYAATFRKYWWIPAITVSLGFAVSFWKGINLPPSYVSAAQMLISGQFHIEGSAHITEVGGDYLATQFALMTSDQVAQRARAKIQIQHPDWIPVSISLDVNQTPRTSFLLLRATGGEPLYTQAFLNAAMQEYLAMKKEMRAERSDNITSAIRNQMILLEKETDADQDELVRFQKANNIGFVQSQNNSAGEVLARLDQEMASLKTELNLLTTLSLDQNIDRSQMAAAPLTSGTNAKQWEKSLGTFDPSFTGNYGPMTDYQRAKATVLQLKTNRQEHSNWKPDNPKLMEIDEEIAKAEKQMLNYKEQSMDILNMRKGAIEYKIQNLQSQIREWAAKATDLSQKLAEYERIRLKLERDKNEYDKLISSLHNVGISTNTELEQLSILENASPAVLTKVNMAKTVGGGIAVGLLAGLAFLFLIYKTNDKISSVVECTGNFKEQTILGQIPHDDLDGDLALLVPYDPRRALLEAFRALRSSIIFAPLEGTRPKALMVTSAESGEGKTVIAANLAATLAFSGAKTLLIDCSLTHGRLHEIFDTSPRKGLVNVLEQHVQWSEAVVQTNIENLFLLPRGEPLAYPAEHYFGAFLKDIYQEFDYIIFDSASVLDDMDVLSFAPILDGVLFVIRFAQTSTGKAHRALDFLNARQVNVLGLVCNDVV